MSPPEDLTDVVGQPDPDVQRRDRLQRWRLVLGSDTAPAAGAASLVRSGVTMIALLALSDSGRPSFDARHAAALAEIGVPAFACTPDAVPELLAAAIERRDIGAWAAERGIVTAHATEG